MQNTPRLLMIGNGMVGHKCLETLVARSAHTHYQIATFCEEPRLAYDRVHLSEYFTGRSAEDLSLVAPDFYETHGITVYRNERAEIIDRQRQVVISQHGREIPYDKLVLATGSFPFVPPVPGRDRPHCLVYRTLDDLEKIAAAAKESRAGAVLGGGLLGLECANALKELGLETHVIEFAPRLMAMQIDDGGAIMLRRKIEKLDVQVHLAKNTTGISAGKSRRHRLSFADGNELETDMVVFSAGIRPRDELARRCELNVGPRGGVVIDNHCRTSDWNIYAIGECALWNGQIFGLVAPGYQMAQVAADHLLGETQAAFTGADMSTKLKLLGVNVASIGDAHGRTPGSRAYSFSDEVHEIYKKIVVSETGRHLLGAVLVGDTDDYGNLLQLALNGIKLPAHPDTLILPHREGSASAALGIDVLPDSAQICSCNNVSKGDLHAAIAGGAMALGDLKACTKASTSCGGCAPLVKQVLDAELKRRGVAVNNHLCEHFPYSRQELYHMVRVAGIKSFKALLNSHGQGRGCDICKPAVASILASCWNEYVLKNEHTGLQDTNDRFLANLQKDGTYSVVPRIPGGEISADKLMVLGQIAKRYGLYTKITGGQRIDMFGARVHQLPRIWRELVDAGFESGHAYAKALRTVKSCVGTSWCRYGVQDSVTMAIHLENRYRGLRAPHKIKMAVSGCTRECAEAQGKDVGVIATEKGWNLYVCGNGGMKPRHADLFATDLDDATLIRTIDRFLMFYIKTADRLQRTATWLNNLEGGLDYLRDVIMDDKLGIGAELEQQMAQVIGTFQCEWKAAVEDPEKLKLFSHFVNNDEPDNRVVFVNERGQIRPAKPEEKIIRLREVG